MENTRISFEIILLYGCIAVSVATEFSGPYNKGDLASSDENFIVEFFGTYEKVT